MAGRARRVVKREDEQDGRGRSGARAMWKGAVTFGLVTVPVALHAATERKNELTFRLLHAKDESPIDYERFCAEEGIEVPWRDIVKGYEISGGRYVVVTDEDVDKARVKATQTFEIRDFVPEDAIDDLYFDHPYYLTPAGRARRSRTRCCETRCSRAGGSASARSSCVSVSTWRRSHRRATRWC